MSRRPALNLVTRDDDDDFEDQEDDSRGVVAELTGADLSTPLTIDHVPAPRAPRGEAELVDAERADLEMCERAVAGLHRALAVAGKALATINRSRLYRETHATFEAYVEDRWGMKRAHAYRLIEAWPVAAELSPIGDTPPEAQVRELLPVAKRYGPGAARAVYEAVREREGRVTAARLREAVRVLPVRRLASPDQAGDLVRIAAAEGRLAPTPPPAASTPAGGQADEENGPEEPDADAGARAVAVLAAALREQRRMYEALPDVVHLALFHDPGRAAMLLRDLGQYASRTAHRARQLAGHEDQTEPD